MSEPLPETLPDAMADDEDVEFTMPVVVSAHDLAIAVVDACGNDSDRLIAFVRLLDEVNAEWEFARALVKLGDEMKVALEEVGDDVFVD